jgi:hypothetical protein
VSRSKIVIKPRLKEYVKRQRTARQTLACFTSLDDPTPDDSDSPGSSSTPVSTKSTSTGAKATMIGNLASSGKPKPSTKVHSGRIKKSPKTQSKAFAETANLSRPMPTPTRCTVPTPVAIPTTAPAVMSVPVPAAAPAAYVPTPVPPPVQRQACTCRDPKECPFCRFLTLADMYEAPKKNQPFTTADNSFLCRFCAIVNAREQKLLSRK